MPRAPLAEAIVQLALKRRVLDKAGCARLAVLLDRAGVADAEAARHFLARSGLLPPPVALRLLEHLPPVGQCDFGDYRTLVHLADGGMGSAWLAADPDEVLVVVKTARAELAGNEEVRKRFGREATIMMQLDHDSVVRCLDCGSAKDGSLFMALEFVDGGDLKDLLEARGTLPESLVLAIAWQVASALVAAEAMELVHRDIKPANIFANEDGRAKLADFGIARSTAVGRTQLTMQGAMVGSPYFMSPEQVIADPEITIAADLYALGVVIFSCLAGIEPYRGSLHDVLHAHREAPIPDLREFRPQISHQTASLVLRCMQKAPADRYPGAAALRDALGEALAALDQHEALPVAVLGGEPGGITVATMPGVALDATGATLTMAAPPADDATLAVDLYDGATVAVADFGSDETRKVPAVAGYDAALGERWITLRGGDRRVVLVARRLLVMGKLCEAPCDICLRNYPVERHREACLKISRQHLRLEYDAHLGPQLTDLGSGNGSRLDGQDLGANRPVQLTGEHRLQVAGVLDLDLHVVPRSGTETWTLDGAPPSTGAFGCGIECSHAADAVVLTRPGNEPGLAYAMVLRRLRLGGSGADLVLPGMPGGEWVEIGLYGGRWITRRAAGDPWQPLLPDSRITIGGQELVAAAGDYGVFG